jgi:endo-1,4-beta-xylanase
MVVIPPATDSALRLLAAKSSRYMGAAAGASFGQATPSRASLTSTFSRFAALGVKVHITELDIRVRVPGATAAELAAQASAFGDIVAACRAVQLCEAIVVWGVSDAESWVPSTFPGYGNALLFDNTYAKKATYTAVKNAL